MTIFVQLLHPGPEPTGSLINGNICNANTVNNGHGHFRKFLHAEKGSYVAPNGQRQDGCFTFWGEWEHASSVLFPAYFPKGKGWPRQLHTALPPTSGIVVNPCGHVVKPWNDPCPPNCTLCNSSLVESTDPFVFCELMLYFCCQIKINGQLNNLKRGDIVVFGSNLDGQFVVDTVFVVADRVPVQCNGLAPLFIQANGAHFATKPCVYRGATFADPVGGMFSFFPALPCAADGTAVPFPRPTLVLPSFPEFISNELKQHHKISPVNKTTRLTHSNFDVWSAIVTEIEAQGNVLGLRA